MSLERNLCHVTESGFKNLSFFMCHSRGAGVLRVTAFSVVDREDQSTSKIFVADPHMIEILTFKAEWLL
jgi:hypothetical protein